MKTKLFFIFLFSIFITRINAINSINNSISAFQDGDLIALIIATYPNIDSNNDNDISVAELDGTLSASSYPTTITLNLDYLTFSANGVNFSGMEHFRISTLRLIGNNYQGNILQGHSLDLSKLGGATATSSFKELYIEGIFFSSLPFATSKHLEKLSFVNCTRDMNLESLNLLPQTGVLKYLEIRNSGLFATLNLKSRVGLKTFLFRNTYIENLNIKNCTNLETLFVEGVGELLSITLPGFNNLKTLTINGMPKLNAIDISNETNLETLNLQTSSGFPNTQISTLNLTNQTKLKVLTIANLDAITSLNLSQNTDLTELLVNQMDNTNALDVTTLINLKKLTVSGNNLKSLDITKNTGLEFLDCFSNDISQIDVSKNIALKELYLNTNRLTKIDTKTNTDLLKLELDDNLLTAINITDNSNLEWLRCQRNNLKIVNVANGNNANMNVWDFKAVLVDQNPALSCILVDANVLNNIPVQWQKDVTSSYSLNDEITYSDATFYNELLNYTEKIDLDENGKIATCEAESYTSTLNIANKNIQNLTGIEKFLNLSGLNCSENSLTELNLTSNPSLLTLNARNNSLTFVDIRGAINLDDVILSKNDLQTINFSSNTQLTKVDVSDNKLTGLGLNNLPKLFLLECSNNSINSLDVKLNPDLEILYCKNNSFLSAATVDNTIDISNNVNLKQINVQNTDITALDTSLNPDLTEIICSDNKLTKLNVANANNGIITSFDAGNNVGLSCIQIDAGFTPPNTWIKDGSANFSANCATASIDNNLSSINKKQVDLYEQFDIL